jgi:hypothetical protein
VTRLLVLPRSSILAFAPLVERYLASMEEAAEVSALGSAGAARD